MPGQAGPRAEALRTSTARGLFGEPGRPVRPVQAPPAALAVPVAGSGLRSAASRFGQIPPSTPGGHQCGTRVLPSPFLSELASIWRMGATAPASSAIWTRARPTTAAVGRHHWEREEGVPTAAAAAVGVREREGWGDLGGGVLGFGERRGRDFY